MKKILISGIVLTGLFISWGCEKAPEPPKATEAPKIIEAPKATETTEAPKAPEAPKVETPAPTGTVKPPVLNHTITDAEVGQKVKCPVMGTELTVTKETLSAEYNGKVYYFCCGGCPDEFKADPDKFAK